MTEIECPKCKAKVDIDSPTVTKEEDGTRPQSDLP